MAIIQKRQRSSRVPRHLYDAHVMTIPLLVVDSLGYISQKNSYVYLVNDDVETVYLWFLNMVVTIVPCCLSWLHIPFCISNVENGREFVNGIPLPTHRAVNEYSIQVHYSYHTIIVTVIEMPLSVPSVPVMGTGNATVTLSQNGAYWIWCPPDILHVIRSKFLATEFIFPRHS